MIIDPTTFMPQPQFVEKPFSYKLIDIKERYMFPKTISHIIKLINKTFTGISTRRYINELFIYSEKEMDDIQIGLVRDYANMLMH